MLKIHVIRDMHMKTSMKYTIYLLEWLKIHTLITPNSGKDAEQEFSFIGSGNASGPVTLEENCRFLTN